MKIMPKLTPEDLAQQASSAYRQVIANWLWLATFTLVVLLTAWAVATNRTSIVDVVLIGWFTALCGLSGINHLTFGKARETDYKYAAIVKGGEVLPQPSVGTAEHVTINQPPKPPAPGTVVITPPIAVASTEPNALVDDERGDYPEREAL